MLDIYKINVKVPETVMTGDTADISTIANNGWYYWIKLYDHVGNSFPGDKYYVGRYLGPKIDIIPALMMKQIEDECRGRPLIYLLVNHCRGAEQ